uniref:GATA transcription factor 19-like n=1 Tax=Erigeron canadensis TaxID=72917 RepID=UPI001CB980A5|nr:GATA transcription factor 19-like [Erigeron canadensis]
MHKCSCGYYHQSSNSFSMLFTMPYDPQQHICPCDNNSNSSFPNVDCTLSLATPSTRLITSSDYYDSAESRPSSRFCWDFLNSDNHHSATPPPPPPSYKAISNRGGATTVDSLLVRRCASCDTTSTPLWRNGPRGPKSLCNACGIRFKKEERRAATTALVAGSGGDGGTTTDCNTWMNSLGNHKLPSCYNSPAAAVGGEFRFVDDVDDRDSSFLSWRLNVTDRPGLVHDFTP